MKTRITELFNIRHPIIQGGMHYVGLAPLASAVSNAGGLGMVTALTLGTPEKLAQIEASEHALRILGFTDSRVRHHGDMARIEVPVAELARFADDTTREEALRAIRATGFRHVTVDLAGLQSGAFTLSVLRRG